MRSQVQCRDFYEKDVANSKLELCCVRNCPRGPCAAYMAQREYVETALQALRKACPDLPIFQRSPTPKHALEETEATMGADEAMLASLPSNEEEAARAESRQRTA